jgi:hypothetical protein
MRGRVTFDSMDTVTLFVWLYAGVPVGRASVMHLVERDAGIAALPAILHSFRTVHRPIVQVHRTRWVSA